MRALRCRTPCSGYALLILYMSWSCRLFGSRPMGELGHNNFQIRTERSELGQRRFLEDLPAAQLGHANPIKSPTWPPPERSRVGEQGVAELPSGLSKFESTACNICDICSGLGLRAFCRAGSCNLYRLKFECLRSPPGVAEPSASNTHPAASVPKNRLDCHPGAA